MMPLSYRYRLAQSEKEELFRRLGVEHSVNDVLADGAHPALDLVDWFNGKLQAAFDEGVAVGQTAQRPPINQQT